MADISLRNYLQEIDGLIDKKQIEEALAHCRYLLSLYPKHLETYRLLGKALLEEARHGDAADIFQRVLSVEPDDFIAHVGMSIVREDEANLDAALWHMERAFEVNPSNAAIQEELRRLYGRRDGIVPPKARLTRGALARMYAQGELYLQAEAELKAALEADPERIDLATVLARVYWNADQRAQAAEICSTILKKLPYSKEANRILADIFQAQGNANDAIPYKQRLQALDPYEAYADPSANGHGAANVKADAIRVPKLDYTPEMGTGESDSPDWVKSIGVKFESAEEAAPATSDTPDWLRNSASPFASSAPDSAPAAGDLPDWLQGMQPSGLGTSALSERSEAQAAPANDWLSGLRSTSAEPDTVPAAEPATEMPDWLKGVTGDLSPAETPASAPAADLPDWLQGVGVDSGTAAIGTPAAEPASDIPDWMKAAQPEAMSAPSTPPAEEEIDWMNPAALSAAVAALSKESPEMTKPAEPVPAEDMPDWLKGMGTETGAPAAEPTSDIPDWMKAAQPEAVATPPAAEEEVDWMNPAALSAAVAALSKESPEMTKPAEPAPAEDMPDWLKGLGTETGTPAAEPASDIPDWMKAAQPEAVATPPAAEEEVDWMNPAALSAAVAALSKESPEMTKPAEPVPAEDMPDWLKGMGTETGTPAAEPASDIPDWMKAAQPEAVATPPAAEEEVDWMNPAALSAAVAALSKESPEMTKPAEPVPAEDMPDWLKGMGTETETPVAEPASDIPDWMKAAQPETPAAPSAPPAEEEIDWMNPAALSAAVAALSKESPEMTKPAEPASDIPDWMKATQPETPSAPPAEEEIDWMNPAALSAAVAALSKESPEMTKPAEPASAAPADDIPDWMKAAQPETPAAPSTPPAEEEIDWMNPAALSAAVAALSKESPELTKPAEPAPAEGIPDWMKAASPEETPPSAIPAANESLPDWLNAADTGQPSSEAATPAFMPAVEKPDWLKQMEAEADAYEATTSPKQTPPALAQMPPTLAPEAKPDWLKQMESEADAYEATLSDEPTPPAHAPMPPTLASEAKPDWLKQMESEADAYEATVSDQPAASTPAPTPPAKFPVELPDFLQPASPEAIARANEPTNLADDENWLAEVMGADEADEKEVEPAQPAELPDWLKAMAPPEPGPIPSLSEKPAPSAAQPAAPEVAEDEADKWLEHLPSPQPSEPASKTEESAVKTPEWLRQTSRLEAEPPAADLPAWAQVTEPDSSPGVTDWLADKKVPDWIRKPGETSPTPAVDWLRAPLEEPPKAQVESTAPSPAATPQPTAEAEKPSTPEESQAELTPPEADDAMRWLEGLAMQHGGRPEEMVTPTEEHTTQPPAWVAAQQEQPPTPEPTPPVTTVQPSATPEASQDEPTAMDSDDALRWLEGLAMQHGGKPEEMVTPAEERTTQPPAWVAAQQEQPPTPEPTPPVTTVQPSTTPEASQDEPTAMDSDDALRWLEGLAMQHGGKPEEMVTQPEERTTQPPAWVTAQQAAAIQSIPEPETPATAPPAAQPKPVEPPATKAPTPIASVQAPPPDVKVETPKPEAEGSEEGDSSRLYRLAEKLAEAKRAKEAEIEARFESQRAEKEAAMRSVEEKMEDKKTQRETDRLRTGPLSSKRPGTTSLRDLMEVIKEAQITTPSTPPPPRPVVRPQTQPLASAEAAPAAPKPPPAPKPPSPPKAARPRKGRAAKSPYANEPPEEVFSLGQRSIDEGNQPVAVEALDYLVASGQLVNEVIAELENFTLNHPGASPLWRVLGDAYMKNNRLQKALEAYRQALDEL